MHVNWRYHGALQVLTFEMPTPQNLQYFTDTPIQFLYISIWVNRWGLRSLPRGIQLGGSGTAAWCGRIPSWIISLVLAGPLGAQFLHGGAPQTAPGQLGKAGEGGLWLAAYRGNRLCSLRPKRRWTMNYTINVNIVKSQRFISLLRSRFNPLWTMNVCTHFHNKQADWQTDISIPTIACMATKHEILAFFTLGHDCRHCSHHKNDGVGSLPKHLMTYVYIFLTSDLLRSWELWLLSLRWSQR